MQLFLKFRATHMESLSEGLCVDALAFFHADGAAEFDVESFLASVAQRSGCAT